MTAIFHAFPFGFGAKIDRGKGFSVMTAIFRAVFAAVCSRVSVWFRRKKRPWKGIFGFDRHFWRGLWLLFLILRLLRRLISCSKSLLVMRAAKRNLIFFSLSFLCQAISNTLGISGFAPASPRITSPAREGGKLCLRKNVVLSKKTTSFSQV